MQYVKKYQDIKTYVIDFVFLNKTDNARIEMIKIFFNFEPDNINGKKMAKVREILKRKSQFTDPLSASVEDIFADIENKIEHKDEVEVVEKEGKKIVVFNDPLYSREPRSTVNYSIFRGKWEFEPLEDIDETDPDKCAVQFTPLNDSAKVIIAFKSIKDRVEFMNSIYANEEMKQIGTGMSFEKLANSKVLKTTGGLLGLTMAGYGLYKIFSKKEEE